MNIKQRLNALETKANPKQPWLILNIDGCPTDEQQAEIDKAKRTGRFTLCFYRPGDGCYIVNDSIPPWENQQ